MSAGVNEVLAQIAVIQHEIISPDTHAAMKSYGNVPYTISAADMPLFVTFVSALNSNVLDGTENKMRDFIETRNYKMILYHSPYGAGVEGEKFALLSPYFDLVYNKFMGLPHLERLSGVIDATIVSDTGMEMIQKFINQSYFGISFTLQVKVHAYRKLQVGD